MTLNEKINEKIIRITKTANIPQELQAGHEYILTATAHCEGDHLRDNHDGTFNRIYTLALLGEMEIKDDLGEKITAKVKGSPSQKFRWLIQSAGEDYEALMGKILGHSEEVIEFVKKL